MNHIGKLLAENEYRVKALTRRFENAQFYETGLKVFPIVGNILRKEGRKFAQWVDESSYLFSA
ncbi:hypothetical protein GCM10026983_28340 [Gracilibacillus alcaliphilus]